MAVHRRAASPASLSPRRHGYTTDSEQPTTRSSSCRAPSAPSSSPATSPSTGCCSLRLRGSTRPLDFIWMWGGDYACRALASAGAAASHAEILRRTVKAAGLDDVDIVGARVPPEALASPRYPGYAHTFADIAAFPRESSTADGETAWRIAEFKGTDPARSEPPEASAAGAGRRGHRPDRRPRHRLPRPLPRPARRCWRPSRGDIVWQTGAPLAGSPLADLLLGDHADALTVLTSSDELRKAGLQVGYPLSWERLTEEIVAAVRAHSLAQARRVIVIVGASGAVIVERDGDDVLVFDPRSQEGDWGQRISRRRRRLRPLPRRRGDLAAHDRRRGRPRRRRQARPRAPRGPRTSRASRSRATASGRGSPFPLGAVAAALRRRRRGVRQRRLPPGPRRLDPRPDLRRHVAGGRRRDGWPCAASGPALRHPGRDGGRLVVGRPHRDREPAQRAQHPRRVRAAGAARRCTSACRCPSPSSDRPAPARRSPCASWRRCCCPGRIAQARVRPLADALGRRAARAFHEIRDVALRGDLALVFWDEFDAPLDGEPLGWLRHFLSPMAEGRFHDGAGFHPLGPAIFVFAGGTAASFEDFIGFRRRARGARRQEARLRQPPARLRRRHRPEPAGRRTTSRAPLRRALILRSLIAERGRRRCSCTTARRRRAALQIDEGVLRAFLEIGEYIHGARSMEAIVQMSSLAGKPRFERSSLPARQQLARARRRRGVPRSSCTG